MDVFNFTAEISTWSLLDKYKGFILRCVLCRWFCKYGTGNEESISGDVLGGNNKEPSTEELCAHACVCAVRVVFIFLLFNNNKLTGLVTFRTARSSAGGSLNFVILSLSLLFGTAMTQDGDQTACVLWNCWLLTEFLELEFTDSYLQYWKIILLRWTKATEWCALVCEGRMSIHHELWIGASYTVASDANIHTCPDCPTMWSLHGNKYLKK